MPGQAVTALVLDDGRISSYVFTLIPCYCPLGILSRIILHLSVEKDGLHGEEKPHQLHQPLAPRVVSRPCICRQWFVVTFILNMRLRPLVSLEG